MSNLPLIPGNVRSFSFNRKTGVYRFVMVNDGICLCPMHLLSGEMIDFVALPEVF